MLIVFCATSRYYSHTKCQKFGPLESSGDLRELALAAVQVVPFLVLSFYYWQSFFFVPWLRLGCSGFMLVWSNFGHFWEDKVKSRRSNLYTKNVFFVVYFCLFVFLSCKRYLTKNPVHCQCPYYSIDEIVSLDLNCFLLMNCFILMIWNCDYHLSLIHIILFVS